MVGVEEESERKGKGKRKRKRKRKRYGWRRQIEEPGRSESWVLVGLAREGLRC